MKKSATIKQLQEKIHTLEAENASLRRDFNALPSGISSVTVPEPFKPVFDKAQKTVNEYFRNLKMNPSRGTIEINDQRYVLVRASSLSKDFLDTVQNLYADRGEEEAMAIGKNFLFDIAHVIGMNDARNFHAKMNLTDPIAKLSAGPVHFAYSGWAFVDILPESRPSPDDNFYLIYHHPYSFESDSWIRSAKKSSSPVCIMNAGYSSGWCEESFGIPLTAVEVSCRAKGDETCTFIMSPPHKIQEHLNRFNSTTQSAPVKSDYEVPTFFERKKVEEEMKRSHWLAEESAKSKSEFVANMSHELRTPLGAILGFTDMLKKTELSTVQKDYLEAISSSGNNLLSIINDILDLSKLDAGKFIIEAVPFNISELLHSVQVMFATKARKKGLQFVCTVDTAISYSVIGDPMRLTQVLVNLIGNAIKFTEKGGVYVNCVVENETDDAATIQFSIRDTGIGVPVDKTETIFERFTQGDSRITRKYGGTGLGLAITRQLIELQQGHITLKSSEGDGAEFLFSLPYKKTVETPHYQFNKEMVQHLQFDSVKKILLVEDNLMNQKLASVILQSNGFTITLAENGKKAIDILKEESFDLILMDIQMPIMDGYQATALIRNELHIATPIIAMTAHALAGEKEKCIQAGMSDYLSKPFKENDLLVKIARWGANNGAFGPTPKKVIDLSFLMKQTRNNRSFINDMISIFRQQNPKDISSLREAIENEDYAGIYKITHTLRNTAGFFGLDQHIGNEMLTIEKLSKAGKDVKEISDLFSIIEPVCNQAVAELEVLEV